MSSQGEQSMRFKKGESGNPAGRPKGIADRRVKLRETLEQRAPDLIGKLIELALDGDTQALKICVDRCLPVTKSRDEPIEVSGLCDAQSLADQGREVVKHLGNGTLTPSEASAILGALASNAKLIETDELTRRIEALEARRGP